MADNIDYKGDIKEYMDVEQAMKRLRNNRVLLRTLLLEFPESVPWDLLCSQMEAEDLSGAANTVHGIKGMAANLSLTALHRFSAEMEARLKEGGPRPDDLANMREILDRTDRCIAETIASFGEMENTDA